jgi:hypothetical protein
MVQPYRTQMTMSQAYWRWIFKATNTNSEYVLLISVPLQQWLQEPASMLRYTYIVCLVMPDVTSLGRGVHKICVLLGCQVPQIDIYRRFEITHRSNLQGSSINFKPWTAWCLKMGPIVCPETSVTNSQSTRRNSQKERRSFFFFNFHFVSF